MQSCQSTDTVFCLCQYHATLPYCAVAARLCLEPPGIGLARTVQKDGNAKTMFYVFRNSMAKKEKHAAALQQQRDAAQADIDKVVLQVQEAQHGRASLEQQLQQVSEQLSVSQQAQRQVSWEHCC